MIPLFKSHYSTHRSILTLKPKGVSKPDEPDSIIDLAFDNNLKDVFLFEDSIGGLPEADKSCREAGLNLRYGIRFNFVDDVLDKTEKSRESESKYGIFAKNQKGLELLYKISSLANKEEFFYYNSRLDFKVLEEYWDSEALSLVVPFYDSFLFNNVFSFSNCIPDFSYTKPTFFVEKGGLFFDEVLREKIASYCNSNNFEMLETKSVFYKARKDFLSYMTFRCIEKRSSLERPELSHMTSDDFCMEAFSEKYQTNERL